MSRLIINSLLISMHYISCAEVLKSLLRGIALSAEAATSCRPPRATSEVALVSVDRSRKGNHAIAAATAKVGAINNAKEQEEGEDFLRDGHDGGEKEEVVVEVETAEKHADLLQRP